MIINEPNNLDTFFIQKLIDKTLDTVKIFIEKPIIFIFISLLGIVSYTSWFLKDISNPNYESNYFLLFVFIIGLLLYLIVVSKNKFSLITISSIDRKILITSGIILIFLNIIVYIQSIFIPIIKYIVPYVNKYIQNEEISFIILLFVASIVYKIIYEIIKYFRKNKQG